MTKQEWIEQVLPLYIELQPYLLRFKGEWQSTDRYVMGDKILYVDDGHPWWLSRHSWWLPDVYSRNVENARRGLWGMVDWSVPYLDHEIDGTVYISYQPGPPEELWSTGWCTLELALLKALKWQWEREKEGK